MYPRSTKRARHTFLCVAPLFFYAIGLIGCGDRNGQHGAGSAATGQPDRSQPRSIEASSPAATSVNVRAERPTSPNAVTGVKPQFDEVARSLGIDFQLFNDEVPQRYFLPEVMGAGVAWIDFDGDGWLDLFLANGQTLDPALGEDVQHHCHLYRNLEGRGFEQVTLPSQAGVRLYGQGCAVGDFDADGFCDLFIGGFGRDLLLKNNGDGTFEDVTNLSTISDPRWSASSLWMDLDGDALLDLFVLNYVNVTFETSKVCTYGTAHGYCGPGSFDAVDDCVYRNLGDGTFEEVSKQLGLHGEQGKGLAIAAIDFDQDLVPEIYVANDMTANFLFQKRGPQRSAGPLYREIAAESGCALSGTGMNEASMGVAIADFDGDSLPDIFLTHFYHHKNTLYKNLGKLLFDDASYSSKAAATSTESLGFGVVAFDYDRDGDSDLFIANGHVLGPEQQPQKMRAQLLNNTRGVFSDISATAGDYFQQYLLGRSVASADFDNDGDVDLAVSQIGSPFTLLRNDTVISQRPFLGLKLVGRDRVPPVGGRVVVKSGSMEWQVPLTAGGSYLAALDQRLLLAGWTEQDGQPIVQILWPSGHVDRFENLAVNSYWQIHEGSAVPYQLSTVPASGTSVP